MLPSELQLGDIIFFHAKGNIPGITAIPHVAMYTGHIDGEAYVTHSIIRNDTEHGIETTILKELDSCMGGRMEVFRPTNAELGKVAAEYMLQWAQYHIPYDKRRANWMLEIRDVLRGDKRNKTDEDAIQHLLKYLTKEARTKFYERIKFAARRDTCPVKMLAGVKPRGFTCVQAVILAYQISELAPYVKTLKEVQAELTPLAKTEEQIKEVWISDKHCPAEIMFTYVLPDSYVEYSMALRDKEEITDFCFNDKRDTPTHPHYHPSLIAWRFDKEPSIDEFIDKFDSCINLPAKLCFTDAIFAWMQQNPRHWSNIGFVKNKELSFSPEAKGLYRKRKSDLESVVKLNQTGISEQRALSPTSSTASSPRIAPYVTADLDAAPVGSFRRLSLSVASMVEEIANPLLARMYPKIS